MPWQAFRHMVGRVCHGDAWTKTPVSRTKRCLQQDLKGMKGMVL